MPGWAWILIAVAAVLVVALLVRQAMARQRTSRLQGQFGPEYDRTVETTDSRRKAESELAAREERREQLTIRPLTETTRARYQQSWPSVQAQFVDDPATAVASADSLIQSVMLDRGYPVEDFDQRAADVSVDHPQVVENYREGHRLAQRSITPRGETGDNTTEDLRQAMRHYRALFEELLDGDDEPDVATDISRPGGDGPQGGVLMTHDELTTCDLAQRPAGVDESSTDVRDDRVTADDVDGHQAVDTDGAVARGAADEQERLFPDDQAQRLAERWQEIQASFVDQPRESVEQADTLVADLMQRLAVTFADERERLEAQRDSGSDVSTEDLRIALTRYRSFFDRLLAV